MKRAPAGLVLAALLSAVPAASQKDQLTSVDLVEIDAVVLDGKGRPVHGLRRDDFSVKDDNQSVDINTFSEIKGFDPDDPDMARTVALLLDDTGVSATGTQAIQQIARAFIASAAKFDELPVVRLHAREDEAFGDRVTAEGRINAYRGGAWPFATWSTGREVLDRIADISRTIAINSSRRKVIVCIGSALICNIPEPEFTSPQMFERAWVSAMGEAAASNAAVYALVPGNVSFRIGGVAEFTGGEVLASTYDMGPAIDRIFQDAANYYVLGYWGATTSPGTHRVEVKVRTKGARVHARKRR